MPPISADVIKLLQSGRILLTRKSIEVQFEPCETSKMEYLAEILNSILPVINFAKKV